MTYQETIDWLMSRLPMYQRIGPAAIKKDLTNTLRLCEALGNPERSFRSIHVAGTNGKGSVSNWLSAIFQAAGFKTGLYTSPHLLDFRERIRINGEMCPESFVCDFAEQHRSLIEQLEPSFFEITVAMAFDHFAQEQVDIAIIETGLGGRLDSTNVIKPELSIITNIGWDHMAMLGDTLPQIAGEKAGIIKQDVPVLIGEQQSEVWPVFESVASDRHAPLFQADDLVTVSVLSNDPVGLKFTAEYRHTDRILELSTPLFGTYQVQNVKTVLGAVDLLRESWDIKDQHVQKGLSEVRELSGLRGRMDVLRHSPLVLADCAHNSNGIDELIKTIKGIPVANWHIITGAVNDKDVTANLKLMPSEARYYFCRPDIPRGLDDQELQRQAAGLERNGQACGSVHNAIVSALSESTPDDGILICGSIFVVAEALPYFNQST